MFGRTDLDISPDRSGDVGRAVDVLADVIGRLRGDSPCFVAFSGGRDSSAVLAVATRAARAAGIDDPIPVTDRFPGDEGAEESSWQGAVIRHLGLREWIRRDATLDCDLLGDTSTSMLRRYGVVWPPTASSNVQLYGVAKGGVMLTGEGGDAVFGTQRLTSVRRLMEARRPSRASLREAMGDLIPRRLRRSSKREAVDGMFGWLTQKGREEVAELLIRDWIDEPFDWFRSVARDMSGRAGVVGLHNMGVLALDHGTTVGHPLRDPAFVSALAPVCRRLGFTDRTSFMTALFGDLLPRPVLQRVSKATFNNVLFGPCSREFIHSWDGDGADPAVVDVASLRAEWSSDLPSGMTFMLLQQAWIASTAAPTAASR